VTRRRLRACIALKMRPHGGRGGEKKGEGGGKKRMVVGQSVDAEGGAERNVRRYFLSSLYIKRGGKRGRGRRGGRIAAESPA